MHHIFMVKLVEYVCEHDFVAVVVAVFFLRLCNLSFIILNLPLLSYAHERHVQINAAFYFNFHLCFSTCTRIEPKEDEWGRER